MVVRTLDQAVNGRRKLINSRHSSVRSARTPVFSWILMRMKMMAVGAVGNSACAVFQAPMGALFASMGAGVPGMLDSSEVQVLCPGLVETKG